MTNEELLNKMEEEISLRGLSPWTRQEYLCRAKVLMRHFAPKPLADVTDPELRDYLLFIRTETSYCAGTANLFNSTMRFIFGACVGRPVNYQLIPRVKIVRSLPDIMSQDEIQALFDACDDGTKMGLRDKAILMTMYGSGLRLSEVTNLKGSDIYASSGKIKVRFGKGQKDRFTLLSKSHLQVLTDYWHTTKPSTAEGWLFINRSGIKISPRAIQDIFTKRLKFAGLAHKPYTPHTLRHNFATDMLNAGVDVCTIKELLGHTHIQSTTFYLHLLDFEEGLESPLDRLGKKKKGGTNNA